MCRDSIPRVPCVAIVALAFSQAGGARADEDSILLTYRFGVPRVRKSGDFVSVVVPGLENYGAPGEPVLPRKIARIFIPAGFEPVALIVHPSEERRMDLARPIRPGQVPFDPEGPAPEPSRPDPGIYASPGPFPEASFRGHGIGIKHGQRIVILELLPIRYLPRRDGILAAGSLRVEIRLAGSRRKARAARARVPRGAYEELKAFVDNPRDLEAGIEPLPPGYPAAGRAKGVPGVAGQADGAGYEYAVITAPAFAEALGPLAEARTAGGLPAAVFPTDWIYANYDGARPDGGADDATRIRNFIADAYARWGTRFVLLAGDADGSASCPECEAPVVPARYFAAHYEKSIPSDMYYGCLDGTFDGNANGVYGEPDDGPDGGDVDMLFEVHVGRAPIDSVEEAERFVRKTLAYERAAGPALREVCLVGEYLGFGGEYDWGGNLNDLIRSGSDFQGYETTGFENSPHAAFFHVTTLYDRDWPGHAWPREELIGRIEAGLHVINHVGHAGTAYGMKLDNDLADALAGPLAFLLYTQGCYAGSFDDRDAHYEYEADCFAEHLLFAEGGAVAAVANARKGWASAYIADGPSQKFNRMFWHAVLGEGTFRWGAANDRSREAWIAFARADPAGRWCFYQLNTLGDPALLVKLASSTGGVGLSRPYYNGGDEIEITVVDADLDGDPDAQDACAVAVSSSVAGDLEEVILREAGTSSGVFQGSIRIEGGGAASDGVLQIAPPDEVLVRYEDEDDGSGRAVSVREAVPAVEALQAPACPPSGAKGVPYEAVLEAGGGLPPYRYALSAGYEQIDLAGALGVERGDPQQWREDDGFWSYDLPFPFAYYGETFESAIVSSNGFIQFGPGGEKDFSNSIEKLRAYRRIAVLWADLVTEDGDIYVDVAPDYVVFSWTGTSYTTRQEVNAQIQLFRDGRIRFHYGAGNADLDPTVGISAGDGVRSIVSAYTGRASLALAPSIEFVPVALPEGLSLEGESGTIAGIPEEAGTSDIGLLVTDSLGQRTHGRCELRIRQQGLSLDAPSEGELVLKGEAYPIRWRLFGAIGDSVRLDYNMDGSTTSFPFPIAESVPAEAGTFSWVPPTIESPMCRIRILSIDNPQFFTYGGIFSIVGPTIRILSPAARSRWVIGEEALVAWESIGFVGAWLRIDANADGSAERFPIPIAERTENDGELRIPVPSIPSPSFRLRILSLDVPDLSAVSDPFPIVPPSITLLAPNGGECLRTGEPFEIRWAAIGNTGPTVLLDFNRDGSTDAFPHRIGEDPVPNTGRFTWTVPIGSVEEARVRIRSATQPSISAISDAPFSIANRCSIRALFWIPYVGEGEEQVQGTIEAIRTFEPDVEVGFSTATTPQALEADLQGRDAFVMVRQKGAFGVDFEALGASLAPPLGEFVEEGGAVLICALGPQATPFLEAGGLMRAEELGRGTGVCNLLSPLDPVVRGVEPQFAGPDETAWYRVWGPGVQVLAESGGGAVIAVRRVGFGRITLAGFDYYSFNESTARVAANAVRAPLPDAGIRILRPFEGEIFLLGEEVPIAWRARGLGPGRVAIAAGEDGAGDEFPIEIGTFPSGEEGGRAAWIPPPAEPGLHRRFRIRIRSQERPEVLHVSPSVFHVVEPLRIVTAELPGASLGLPYEAEIAVRGGASPYRFEARGLPAGLGLQATGDAAFLAGTPAELCEERPIEIIVTGALGLEARARLLLTVVPRGIWLIRPVGGELYLRGTTARIEWGRSGDVGSTVRIEYNVDGSQTAFPRIIAPEAPIGEPFDWTLPIEDIPRCRLRIVSNQYAEFSDVSGPLSILGPTIRVVRPAADACWQIGDTIAISWQSVGNAGGRVRIELGTEGAGAEPPRVIVDDLPDTGTFEWTVPEEIEACVARLRIASVGEPALVGLSEPFRLSEDCEVRGVLWTAHATPGPRIDHILEALHTHVPDSVWLPSGALTAPSLKEELEGADVLLLPHQDRCAHCDMRGYGRRFEKTLGAFVEGGGVVVACGLRGRALDLLRASDLSSASVLHAAEEGIDSFLDTYLHPVIEGIPRRFEGPRETICYFLSPGAAEILALAEGRRGVVAAAAPRGLGFVVILGFDFAETNEAVARMLANAVRMRRIPQGMEVVSPRGGEVFAAGEEVTVRWFLRRLGPLSVRISYNTDGAFDVFPFPIGESSSPEGASSLTWIAPEPPEGASFPSRIRVESVERPEWFAVSEAPFHVVRQHLRLPEEPLPDAYQRAPYSARIRAEGGVPPYAFGADALPAGLALRATGEGYAALEGSPEGPVGPARISVWVRDAVGSTAAADLDLRILPSEIRIASPAEGARWLRGSTQEIRWDVVGYAGETVRIEWGPDPRNGGPFERLSDAAPIDRPFSWRLPDVEAASCRVRVTSNEYPSISSTSGPFSILPPGIACLSPAPGDCLAIGWPAVILWDSLGNAGGRVRIAYNTDGSPDRFPFLIADDVPDTGRYAWMVSGPAGEACRVRISALDDPTLQGASIGGFSIRAHCALDVLIWIPFTDWSALEVRGSVAALTLFENDLEWELEATTEPDALAAALAGTDAIIVVEQERDPGADFASLARAVGPVLVEFARRGGSVVLLKQPAGRAAPGEEVEEGPEALLRETGLIRARAIGHDLDALCLLERPEDPLTFRLPRTFRSRCPTAWYDIEDADGEVIATVQGEPVVATRAIGEGRVVLIGLDYSTYDETTARLLANAARIVPPGPAAPFVRGDANADGRVDVADAVSIALYLFGAGPDPTCLDAADVDNSARPGRPGIDLADPVFLLEYLFARGPHPPPPFPPAGWPFRAACAQDLEPWDGLGCEDHGACP